MHNHNIQSCAKHIVYMLAAALGHMPGWSPASGLLSAAPTGFSSDAKLVVDSLAEPCLTGPDRILQNPAHVQPRLSPASVRQG